MSRKIDRLAMGQRLREERIEAGYVSAAEFARHADLCTRTYSGYERGERIPCDFALTAICNALNLNKEWLLYGAGQEAQKKPVAGRHEALPGQAQKKAAVTAAPETAGPKNLLELIDAIDDMSPDLPGFLVEGEALRSALHGDPNGDAAPAYFAMLCSKPGVVNYYRDRTHMRELNTAGTISDVEYRDWFVGRRELLRLTPVNPPTVCKATGEPCRPVLKCTAEIGPEN